MKVNKLSVFDMGAVYNSLLLESMEIGNGKNIKKFIHNGDYVLVYEEGSEKFIITDINICDCGSIINLLHNCHELNIYEVVNILNL